MQTIDPVTYSYANSAATQSGTLSPITAKQAVENLKRELEDTIKIDPSHFRPIEEARPMNRESARATVSAVLEQLGSHPRAAASAQGEGLTPNRTYLTLR